MWYKSAQNIAQDQTGDGDIDRDRGEHGQHCGGDMPAPDDPESQDADAQQGGDRLKSDLQYIHNSSI